jgi:hypothetical protein
LGFDTDDFQDAGALIRASFTVSGQAAQLAFSDRLVEEPLRALRKLQLPYRPFLSARIATTVLLDGFTRRVAPKRSRESQRRAPLLSMCGDGSPLSGAACRSEGSVNIFGQAGNSRCPILDNCGKKGPGSGWLFWRPLRPRFVLLRALPLPERHRGAGRRLLDEVAEVARGYVRGRFLMALIMAAIYGTGC